MESAEFGLRNDNRSVQPSAAFKQLKWHFRPLEALSFNSSAHPSGTLTRHFLKTTIRDRGNCVKTKPTLRSLTLAFLSSLGALSQLVCRQAAA